LQFGDALFDEGEVGGDFGRAVVGSLADEAEVVDAVEVGLGGFEAGADRVFGGVASVVSTQAGP
jgi:hypothetical protein